MDAISKHGGKKGIPFMKEEESSLALKEEERS